MDFKTLDIHVRGYHHRDRLELAGAGKQTMGSEAFLCILQFHTGRHAFATEYLIVLDLAAAGLRGATSTITLLQLPIARQKDVVFVCARARPITAAPSGHRTRLSVCG